MTDYVTELRVLARRLDWDEVASSTDVHVVCSAADHIETLEATVETLRKQLRFAQENNRQRNLELDALHYVWCDGRCERGVHRWTDAELTEELVQAAERNTARMRKKFTALEARRARESER